MYSGGELEVYETRRNGMKLKALPLLLIATMVAALTGCGGDDYEFDRKLSQVHTDKTYIKDADGRYLHFRGTNLSGSTKTPCWADENGEYINCTYIQEDGSIKLPTGDDPVTHVGNPFPPEKVDEWMKKLADEGFNSLRLLFIWEAVFPNSRDVMDEKFLDYFENLIATADKYGIYVLINAHENMWSRHLYSLYNEDAAGEKGDVMNMLWSLLPDLERLRAGREQCWTECADLLSGKDAELCEEADEECEKLGPACTESYDTCKLVAEACVEEGTACDEATQACDDARDACSDADAQCIKRKKGCRDACEEANGTLPEVCDTYYRDAYTDRVAGDGAPLWATKACLPEKNFNSPYFGLFKLWGTMAIDEDLPDGSDFYFILKTVITYLRNQNAKAEGEVDGDADAEDAEGGGMAVDDATLDEVEKFIMDLKPYLPDEGYHLNDTSNLLPFTMWGLNNALSLDVQRCYASFFAGDDVYPDLLVDKDGNGRYRAEMTEAEIAAATPIKEYLQSYYTKAWVEIAKRAVKYDNVLGYDIINEPVAILFLLTAVAAYFDLGGPDQVEKIVKDLLPTDMIGDETIGEKAYNLITALDLLPRDNSDESRTHWGLKGYNLGGLLGANSSFGLKYLQPLYERVGQAIQEVDPEAVIWIEPSMDWQYLLTDPASSEAMSMQELMNNPKGIKQVVYSPHWYPDIYPMVGFNMPSRIFHRDEYDYRDYTPMLTKKLNHARDQFGNVPTVFGEFGTYWNYRYRECGTEYASDIECNPDDPGYLQSRAFDYEISTEILDNYYENFEAMLMSNMVWCYTADNDPKYGDMWNHEDFSVVDENGEPRGEMAWMRPYAKAISGKPVSMHFYSDYHYFDPSKGHYDPETGKSDDWREFEVIFESKETDAPTIVWVPKVQYPTGFYVWLSDGWATWDAERNELYFYPTSDQPDWQHWVKIRPPMDGRSMEGWNYYIQNGKVVNGG